MAAKLRIMVAQSSEQAPFTSEIVACILVLDPNIHVRESVNALLRIVCFLRVLRFPPTGNVDWMRWDLPALITKSFHRSCALWSSDMRHKVSASGALSLNSTRSGWVASFTIHLGSQLQVKLISIPTNLLYFSVKVTEHLWVLILPKIFFLVSMKALDCSTI